MYLFEFVNFLHLRLDDADLLFSDGRVLTDLRQNSNCTLESATKQCDKTLTHLAQGVHSMFN